MRHEKVDMIFQAAVEVFAESGFDQAKMDDIAQMAGVAKGTIYYHFKSKEELFAGLINEGIEKLIEYANRHIESVEEPVAKIQHLIKAHVLFFIHHAKLAKLLLNEAFGTKERQRHFRGKIREYITLIEKVLIEGKEKGDFNINHTLETASAIFGAASVIVLQKLYHAEDHEVAEMEKDLPAILETLDALLIKGIVDVTEL
ncbi:TetR family transcriptional regulator [Laceyella sacchari]|uniref:TetR/AcrR family transcriptional regulator n=1 Tax=Laceyella sacchari TaxID=37482 RepID=UPI001050A2D1|nr:TetR/AcrR family transcriptional regulator [Laceyella sacchari]TCW39392.1 TetR family transcriptional regulator [Laceyella sacchari]